MDTTQRSPRWAALLGAALIALVMLLAPAAGEARADPAPVATGEPYAWPVLARIPNLSLFQCPYLYCNQGVAEQNRPLVAYCYLPNPPPPPYWGGHYYLVVSEANTHVGFASSVFLSDPHGGNDLPDPRCTDVGSPVRVTAATAVHQCRSTACNQGQVAPGQRLIMMPGPRVDEWSLVYNTVNQHVGWIHRTRLHAW